jgi:flavodoxin
MGKTAIFYYSQHHGNTKKVLDAIAMRSEDTSVADSTPLAHLSLWEDFKRDILQRKRFRLQWSFTRICDGDFLCGR